MELKKVQAELEKLGTEQNRKVYKRHGIQSELFGVSYTNLKTLAKKISKNTGLAEELWATNNHDSRILATMIADPGDIKRQTIEDWSKTLDNYVITDALSGFVAQTAFSDKLMDKWIKSKQEWIGASGWNILAKMALQDIDKPDDYFESLIEVIEKNIQKSKNRVKYSMNSALIAIGVRNNHLKNKAVKAAKNIGTVEVDHGDTNCKTPDAIEYIKRASDRKRLRFPQRR